MNLIHFKTPNDCEGGMTCAKSEHNTPKSCGQNVKKEHPRSMNMVLTVCPNVNEQSTSLELQQAEEWLREVNAVENS